MQQFGVNNTAFVVLSQWQLTTMLSLHSPRLSTCIQSRKAAVFFTVCQQIETEFTLNNKGINAVIWGLQLSFMVLCFECYLDTYWNNLTFLKMSTKWKSAAKDALLEVTFNLYSDRKHVGRSLKFSKQQCI